MAAGTRLRFFFPLCMTVSSVNSVRDDVRVAVEAELKRRELKVRGNEESMLVQDPDGFECGWVENTNKRASRSRDVGSS
jgi:hypothetical protein